MTTPSTSHAWAKALLFITPALWAVNYIVARKAPGVVEPHALAFGRWAIAALVLVWLARTELRAHASELRRDVWRYLALGALGMWICGAWVYQGARSTSAMNIALIYAVSPVLIAFGAMRWLGERMSGLQVVGAGLALSGVLHVVLKGQWLQLANVRWVEGDLWIVACTFSWAAYALLLRHWRSSLSPQARLAATASAGVAVLLPLTLWEWANSSLSPFTAPALSLMALAAFLPGLGAYWAYAVMQRELGAARVGMALYMGPLYAALLAWLLLGESLTVYHWVGALMIIPGLILVLTRRKT